MERDLKRLLLIKEQHETADAEIDAINQKIAFSGGMVAPREHLLELRQRKQEAANSLKETVEAIHETGCQLKDVEIGLIDFPTLYRGKEVYLCWKLGESKIGFWHQVEDGYRGRHAIDSEFLSNHRGDERH